MAIVNKDKYLKDIAGSVQRGAVYFETEDRPAVEMGGRRVFVSSVYLDQLSGTFAYTVSNAAGDVLPSAYGLRPLQSLDVKTLSDVAGMVGLYRGYRLQRERSLSEVSSQVSSLSRRSFRSL